MKNKLLLFIFITNFLFASDCSPYFNPDRFYESPEYLQELLKDIDIDDKKIKFTIEKKELYRFNESDIANEINENFGGFWNDWLEDGYEMQLTPEDTVFKYKDNYLSLQVFIYGVKGDATEYKGTIIKYKFYNYTKDVSQYIICKKKEKS